MGNKLKEIIGTPIKHKVQVLHKGKWYEAEEEDIRYLQVLVCNKKIKQTEFRVFDCDANGKKYELRFREDGVFVQSFTSNIFSLNSMFTLSILATNRKK